MKRISTILILALVLAPIMSFGQKKMVKKFNTVKTELTPAVELIKAEKDMAPVLVKKGNNIDFKINIQIPPKYMHNKAVLRFAIVGKSANNGDLELFEPIILKGKKVKGNVPMIDKKKGGSFEKNYSLKYTPDLQDFELYLTPVIYKAKKEIIVSSTLEEIKLKNKKVFIVEPKLSAIGTVTTQDLIQANQMVLANLQDKYEKETIISKSANIYFPVNRAEVNFKFGMNKNQASMDSLKNLESFIAKGWQIKDITVNGFASPEGEESFNVNLSDKRAANAEKEVKSMIAKIEKANKKIDKNATSNTANINIAFTGNGPDWNGLLKEIENSNFKDKNAILNVVNSADPTKKENELRNMILIYPELEENYLPPLRKSVITVNCYEPKKTAEQIYDLALNNPSELNGEEIMYAACELAKNDNDRMKILENAIKVIPNDVRPYNNLAVLQLKQNNAKGAEANLMKANKIDPNNKEVLNNMGVLYTEKADYAKAKQYFDKSKIEATKYNLGLIQFVEGDWSGAANIVNKKCDYNSALVKTMLQDYKTSQTMLECATPNAANFYLRAINFARQNNTDQAIQNLKEAIKLDSNESVKAGNDVEFIKLVPNSNFQSLIK